MQRFSSPRVSACRLSEPHYADFASSLPAYRRRHAVFTIIYAVQLRDARAVLKARMSAEKRRKTSADAL